MARSTLEQWRMLKAVVENGGFAQAAKVVHKSQSSINHAIHKLQDQLGVKLLVVKGRKAFLTDAGELLLRRSETLIASAEGLEQMAASLGKGLETEIRLAVDQSFPPGLLSDIISSFDQVFPEVRVQVFESVLNGSEQLITSGEVDIAITPINIPNLLGEFLFGMEFIAVAGIQHELHRDDDLLSLDDLELYKQIVVRDSSVSREGNLGWLGAEKRLTVSHISTSIEMVKSGQGYAWLPKTFIEKELETGQLKPLNLSAGTERLMNLYIYQSESGKGKAASVLIDLVRGHATNI